MTDDIELLRRYVEASSEDAFTELVHRHIDFVYAAALRQTRNPHRAQDITQTVFTDLARKASALVGRTEVVGWLYISTHYAGTTVIRSEARRETREREITMIHESSEEQAATVDWQTLDPVLDPALRKLNDSDRTAILLRFFKNHSFAEIGTALRVTEEAARKRTDRALDRLRSLLERQGVTSTSAALAVALSNQVVVAAPLGLAGVTASAALAGSAVAAGGATVAATNLLTIMKTSKVLITVTGLVAAVAVGISINEARLRRQSESTAAALRNERDELRRALDEANRQGAALQSEADILAGKVTALQAHDQSPPPATPAPAPPGPSLGRLRTLTELWKGKILSLQPDLIRGRVLTLQVRPLEGNDKKLVGDFVDLFGLTPAEQENLQRAVDRARDQVAELERSHATVSADGTGNKVVIAISPFTDSGGPISSELMQSFAEILGPERNSAFNALGASDQIERELGNFGAAQRTITISYDPSDAASPYSVRNEVKQGSEGTFRTVNRGATLDQATSQIGNLAQLIPPGFGGKK